MKMWVPPLLAAVAGIGMLPSPLAAQDQQLGARTRAMGGSYTAFEDDPVSVWLNPAGIATQSSQASIAYQTYTTYPLHRNESGATVQSVSAQAETTLVEPAFVPAFLGVVFQAGGGDSPLAIGVCYAQPYEINYSFDHVQDPFQSTFTPNSNVQESFSRFRVAMAKDFRLRPADDPGFFNHLSIGLGVDLAYARYQITTDTTSASDNVTAPGGGAGLLLGLFDNGKNLKVNFGAAYQSEVRWHWSNDPRILPAFDMPNQINAGLTGYFMDRFPLRTTLDFQWVNWKNTTNNPTFPGEPSFKDAYNYSAGAEYRIPVNDTVSVYPRVGFRRFDAPWGNKENLPMTDTFKLVVDTKGGHFNIVTGGLGISWSDEHGKSRSVDLAFDVGGDTYNMAFGLTYEF